MLKLTIVTALLLLYIILHSGETLKVGQCYHNDGSGSPCWDRNYNFCCDKEESWDNGDGGGDRCDVRSATCFPTTWHCRKDNYLKDPNYKCTIEDWRRENGIEGTHIIPSDYELYQRLEGVRFELEKKKQREQDRDEQEKDFTGKYGYGPRNCEELKLIKQQLDNEPGDSIYQFVKEEWYRECNIK